MEDGIAKVRTSTLGHPGHWPRAEDQVAGASTSFLGGYVEVGTWVTGDRQAWHIDRFLTTRPKHNLHDGRGGHGGVWVGYRFGHLDLNDGAILGGEQHAHTFGINWAWNWNTRLMLNYVFVDIRSGPAGPGVLHIISLRTQFNF